MFGQPNDSMVGLALVAVIAFVLWLVLFTGDGYKGILEDLKSINRKKPEKFPVPVFDRSKIELPRPKKPTLQTSKKKPVKLDEEQLVDFANQLMQSAKDIRKEAAELVKAYNAMPPSLVEDPSKPRRKPAGKSSSAKKTTKSKPTAKKAAPKEPVKKAAPKATKSSKPSKKAAPKKKGR